MEGTSKKFTPQVANPEKHVSLLFLHSYTLWSCKYVTLSQTFMGREDGDVYSRTCVKKLIVPDHALVCFAREQDPECCSWE